MFHGFAGEETGVSEVEPKTCPYRFEEQILLGYTEYSYRELEDRVLKPLCNEFISKSGVK